MSDERRSHAARAAAERALVRVVHFYGSTPAFVLLVRGTGYAARDTSEMELTAEVDGIARTVRVRVTGLAGFLLAKVGAAKSRSKPRDWYDIAYVLLHNDAQVDGAEAVLVAFGPVPQARTALRDLQANFEDHASQGTSAYVQQVIIDDPDLDPAEAGADALLAVTAFCSTLLETS